MEASDLGSPTKAKLNFGKWSTRCARAAVEHPALSVPILTVALFLVVRIPTQIFYSRLGITPEDAGLNSVQVLLEGAAADFLIAVVFAAVYLLAMAAMAVWAVAMMRKNSDAPSWTIREQLVALLEWSAVPVAVLAIVGVGAFLSMEALNGSSEVREGKKPEFELAPWSAWPTQVHWEPGANKIPLPGCRSLFYLGEGGGHVVLFDSDTETTYRIGSDLIQTAFPQSCG